MFIQNSTSLILLHEQAYFSYIFDTLFIRECTPLALPYTRVYLFYIFGRFYIQELTSLTLLHKRAYFSYTFDNFVYSSLPLAHAFIQEPTSLTILIDFYTTAHLSHTSDNY